MPDDSKFLKYLSKDNAKAILLYKKEEYIKLVPFLRHKEDSNSEEKVLKLFQDEKFDLLKKS